MGIIETATSPWGQTVPIHAAFYLIWVALIVGLAFFMGHAIWLRYFARKEEFSGSTPANVAARIPDEVPRHSLAARMFHWVMAASMFVLLFSAFLPKVGIQFVWLPWHWIAGLVLVGSILFHLIHATFFMDFWAIWPNKDDIKDGMTRFKRSRGENIAPPRRFGKYPMENKMYHLAIVFAGLAVAITGFFMLFKIRTPLFERNPYILGFTDMSWGMMYVLHGLAGIGLIFLIMTHVYFALRPEKIVITKSMVFGTLDKEHYLQHHDHERWKVTGDQPLGKSAAS